MEFNEKNMIDILGKATKPLGIKPAFVIIDDYKGKIKNSMACNHIGKEGESLTATTVNEKNKVFKQWLTQ